VHYPVRLIASSRTLRATGAGRNPMAKMKAYASFDLYLADQPPHNQTIIKALRGFVRQIAPKLEESVKWGNGCWLKGKVPVAYVYSDKGFVQFGFMRGSVLKDPKKLLEGSGAHVRHIKVRRVEDIDKAAFAALLRQAIDVTPESFKALKDIAARSKKSKKKAVKATARRAKNARARKAK
jgi:hypothetical protein